MSITSKTASKSYESGSFLCASRQIGYLFVAAVVAHLFFRISFSLLLNTFLPDNDLRIIEKTYYVTQSIVFSYILMPTLFILASFIFSRGLVYKLSRVNLFRYFSFIIAFYLALVIFHIIILFYTRVFLEWAYIQQKDMAVTLTTIVRALCPIAVIPLLGFLIPSRLKKWELMDYPVKYYRILNIILFTLLSGSLASILSGPIFWLSDHFHVLWMMILTPLFCAYKLLPEECKRVEVRKIVSASALYILITMLIFPVLFSFLITTIPYMLYLYSFHSVTGFMYIIMFTIQFIVCKKSIRLFFNIPVEPR